ncbi:hypothetical protein GUJ93_ZPchr0002g24103 [Zizania palustris]|uniref:Uncharacterized protein n=1 Tax=Zizania palustris TaxID=103762 RepID=A0A8J5SRY8_ZIZPA|nr:hypothetical protein GUJ93_ZPchr0002g24103 [Zizania palustris]
MKESKSTPNPPDASDQPPKGGGNDYSDKGKRHMEYDDHDDISSEEGGKVDIPDYLEELSGDDGVEELNLAKELMEKKNYTEPTDKSFGVEEMLGNLKGFDSQEHVEPMEPIDQSYAMAIVPYIDRESVEVLLAPKNQNKMPNLEEVGGVTIQEMVLGERDVPGARAGKKSKKNKDEKAENFDEGLGG